MRSATRRGGGQVQGFNGERSMGDSGVPLSTTAQRIAAIWLVGLLAIGVVFVSPAAAQTTQPPSCTSRNALPEGCLVVENRSVFRSNPLSAISGAGSAQIDGAPISFGFAGGTAKAHPVWASMNGHSAGCFTGDEPCHSMSMSPVAGSACGSFDNSCEYMVTSGTPGVTYSLVLVVDILPPCSAVWRFRGYADEAACLAVHPSGFEPRRFNSDDFVWATHPITLVAQEGDDPVAVIAQSPDPDDPLTINFDGSASFDPDGIVESYAWQFQDGDGLPVGSSAEAQTSFRFAGSGSFSAILTVRDDTGRTGRTQVDLVLSNPLDVSMRFDFEAIGAAPVPDPWFRAGQTYDGTTSGFGDGDDCRSGCVIVEATVTDGASGDAVSGAEVVFQGLDIAGSGDFVGQLCGAADGPGPISLGCVRPSDGLAVTTGDEGIASAIYWSPGVLQATNVGITATATHPDHQPRALTRTVEVRPNLAWETDWVEIDPGLGTTLSAFSSIDNVLNVNKLPEKFCKAIVGAFETYASTNPAWFSGGRISENEKFWLEFMCSHLKSLTDIADSFEPEDVVVHREVPVDGDTPAKPTTLEKIGDVVTILRWINSAAILLPFFDCFEVPFEGLALGGQFQVSLKIGDFIASDLSEVWAKAVTTLRDQNGGTIPAGTALRMRLYEISHREGLTVERVLLVIESQDGGAALVSEPIVKGYEDAIFLRAAALPGFSGHAYSPRPLSYEDPSSAATPVTGSCTPQPVYDEEPVAKNDRFTIPFRRDELTLRFNVLQNNGLGPDFDPDGDPLRIEAVAPGEFPRGSGNTLSHDVSHVLLDVDPGTEGDIIFWYVLTDERDGRDTGRVDIHINEPPQVTDLAIEVPKHSADEIRLVILDRSTDPDGPFSDLEVPRDKILAPDDVAPVIQQDDPQTGVIVFRPPKDFEEEFQISFTVTDRYDATTGTITVVPIVSDMDADAIEDFEDNCPLVPNQDQSDLDGDELGDECDNDDDDDGVLDDSDNCQRLANQDQLDLDGDELGDECDNDDDDDGVLDDSDNCQRLANQDQLDLDGDELGDECDNDDDGDGVPDASDNCGAVANADQADLDGDGLGDVCDPVDDRDGDGDGVPDASDNCGGVANADQADLDGDGLGDVCDPVDDRDGDGDGVPDASDNCGGVANAGQADLDGDGLGDVCDAIVGSGSDSDGDGVADSVEGSADRNNDGIPDWQQPWVGYFALANGVSWTIIGAPDHPLDSLRPHDAVPADPAVSHPAGQASFVIGGIEPGGLAKYKLEVLIPNALVEAEQRVGVDFGRINARGRAVGTELPFCAPANQDLCVEEVSHVVQPDAFKVSATIQIRDGGPGDRDGLADGRITDPVAIAFRPHLAAADSPQQSTEVIQATAPAAPLAPVALAAMPSGVQVPASTVAYSGSESTRLSSLGLLLTMIGSLSAGFGRLRQRRVHASTVPRSDSSRGATMSS